MGKKSRAYGSEKHQYYELLQDIPCVSRGAIFYWDKKDKKRGSIAEGCLKLCWTPSGGYYGNERVLICANTIVFHASARFETEWFKEV